VRGFLPSAGLFRSDEAGTCICSLCPFVADYVFGTATPAEGSLSATSPLGYAYPDHWPSAVRDSAAHQTRMLMESFGVRNVYGYKHYAGTGTMIFRGKTISNSFNVPLYGQFQSATGADLTVAYDPLLPSQEPVTGYASLL